MGSVDETKVFRLALSGRKCLYLLNHLASSISQFFWNKKSKNCLLLPMTVVGNILCTPDTLVQFLSTNWVPLTSFHSHLGNNHSETYHCYNCLVNVFGFLLASSNY